MKRLTTDSPDGNFETMMNFVYGKDGWAYIRHDGEHSDVRLTGWAKRQCMLRGCDEVLAETPEEIDQRLCDCMMDGPICPIAMAYCFASQAVHLRSRLKMHEDAMPIERVQELAQAEKDGRLVVHGRWRFHKYVSKYECTECGHFVKPGTDRNYCPNCGAKMDFPEAALKKREELDL